MPTEKILIDNKAVAVHETETFTGKGALQAPTPKWAKWMFRGTLIVTSAVTIWIGSTGFITPPNKVEVLLILKGVDFVVYGVSKLFGVRLKEDEDA